ncbi:zf-CGNR multi-domain protein [Mycetocola tolaasinivorans]|uniref:Zf-CGNR multi-domain protein n=1 Tax=Mycetocola tolaasinivorans TaxID=76635 RepID=A0A3L7A6Z7_9MICO|nr:ABATE domain-containing protein [Mycetocola tolaasinivorans]RLP75341.1 zf-CGNR multi-domain protein [Mycetocola tolaasinivorans]
MAVETRDTGALVVDFVSTRAGAHAHEQFTDPAGTADWFTSAGLIPVGTPVSEADVWTVRELRDALSALLAAHLHPAKDTDTAPATAAIERIAAVHPLMPRLTPTGMVLVGTQSGMAGGIGTLLAHVATVAANPREWVRFKTCGNHTCHLGFRDNTRNGSGLYCGPGCAAQVNMRAYRKRNAAEPTGPAAQVNMRAYRKRNAAEPTGPAAQVNMRAYRKRNAAESAAESTDSA